MTIKKSLTAVIVGTVITTLLACCQLIDTLYAAVNLRLEDGAEQIAVPGIVRMLSSPLLLTGAIILFSGLILIMGMTCRKYPEYSDINRSIPNGVIGLAASIVLGWTLINGFRSVNRTEEISPEELDAIQAAGAGVDKLAWQICMGVGICGAVALAVIAIGYLADRNMLEVTPLIMLMPVLWLGMRLVLTFLELTSSASVAERSAEQLTTIVMTLFMLSLGKYLAGTGGNASKWANVYGGLAAMFAISTGISRVVMMLVGNRARDGAFAQVYAETAESYGLAPNYGDIALGVFAVMMILHIAAEQREQEEEMAFGRKRREENREQEQQQMQQDMYQRQMQQNMYQRQMQQNMYQRQMQQNMYQRQMQQNMYQRQMQQNMYQRQMGQQGMYQPPMGQMGQMGQPGMYQQPMNQQNMYQQNGMPAAQPLRHDAYQEGMQQPEAAQRGRPERRGGSRGGSPDAYTHRGAGMKVTDSFEVRTYGGPSINSRKKFGGLDSFRDQMLSGQSALNMQSEEQLPAPPPVVNLTDEEAAMQAVLAAALAAEDVNEEIDQLSDMIRESVDRAPERRSEEKPDEVELNVPDDEAVISVLDDDDTSDEHIDDRDYPSPPPKRTVTLGSGRHEGTLTDRLAELEEYKRRDARRQPPEESYEEDMYDMRGRGARRRDEEYYDEYDDGYEDGYDEYDDEYEDDYDYDEYEYEDGYEDDYDDGYDEYDDEYDEYDDEYDEYDDEYEDDDYYDDDDDGYYEE